MVLDEVATYLIANGFGTVLGTDIFLGKIPPDPDGVIVLTEYGGEPSEFNLGATSIRFEYPSIQVLVRGAKDDYQTPRTTANGIFKQLAKVLNQNLSGIYYLAIDAKQSPFFKRRDENDRVEIVCNYKVWKAPS